jgi:hypothetical protein
MFDLEVELQKVVAAFDDAAIPYALCGGMAVGVHGYPRATVDIDLLIQPEDVTAAEEAAEGLGYRFKARPMSFQGGAVEIRRISKVDPADGETLMLDLLLVTHANGQVWETREQLAWNGRSLWVVSREGLIALKTLRASDQDRADIAHLQEPR